MFIRPCYRKKNGKRHAYWALVESYRTERGPRQRVVSYLGQMDAGGRLEIQYAAQSKTSHQKTLFNDVKPEWVEVDVNRVRVEGRVDFGGPWLALQLIRKLQLDTFLKEIILTDRSEISWSAMTQVLVICRFCDPSSELHIAEHGYAHSALKDLLGIPVDKIDTSCRRRRYKLVTIAKRVGRLLGKNSRAAGLFDTDFIQAKDGRTKLIWKKLETWRQWAEMSEGCYLLRTNVTDWSEEELWRAYMQLTEAEL